MGLSKSLKAKLLSIPSGVANLSTPGLDRLSGKTTAAVPSFDHPLWRQLLSMRSHWRALLDVYACVFHKEFRVLSLSMVEGRSTFGIMVGI